MTADRNLRRAVSELMVIVHLVTPELAEQHVAEMDQIELWRRFCMYTGMELSAEWRQKQSGSDFYQVFGSATATARYRHSTLFLVPDRSGAGKSLPELEEKTWSEGGGGR